jgi:energy-coupling factor transporter ATP-binding protein EcfA2
MSAVATWVQDVSAELFRGRHVLLHGNVADQVHWEDGFRSIDAVLLELLGALGYELVATYDLVDGFELADREAERDFHALYTDAVRAQAGPASAPPQQQDDPRLASLQATVAERNGQAGLEVDGPLRALAAIRAVCAQQMRPVAVVVQRAELLFGSDEGDEARRARAYLSHALREAAFVGGSPTPKRNALVLIGSASPGELLEAAEREPQLAQVAVPLPAPAEREAFLRHAAADFYGGELDAADAGRSVASLTRLTEGFRIWDLDALRRTSHIARIPLGEPRRLTIRYLRGQRESSWSYTDPSFFHRRAREVLGGDVMGQDAAIETIATRLNVARNGVGFDGESGRREQQPRATFFFVGPTGVGKTELAKGLARLLAEDESALIRFDMTEYQDETSRARLTGSDPGFVGFEQGGQLVNAVIERPAAVLLFDEIEKAHPRVLDLFLQLLDDGRLTDGHGRTADFRDSIVIFTSNAGAAAIFDDQRRGEVRATAAVHEHFRDAVRDRLSLPEPRGINRPELHGRLKDAVVPFDVIRPHVVEQIAGKLIAQWRSNVARVHGIEVEVDEQALLAEVQRRFAQDALKEGARSLVPCLRELLDEPLARYVALNAGELTDIRVVLDDGRAAIEPRRADG